MERKREEEKIERGGETELIGLVRIDSAWALALDRFPRKRPVRDFPGGPVVRALRSRCRGPGCKPWSGN